MASNEILVSIIVNCYNGEKYLEEALRSIKKQKYSNFELIFWDNLSTDNSKKIFLTFDDSRFKYFLSQKKMKLYEARNSAVLKCNGDLITFLDVDDVWLDNKLLEQVNEFKKKNFDICYSDYYIKRNKSLKLQKVRRTLSNFANSYLKHYDVALVTICINRGLVKKDKFLFNNTFNIIGDFAFMMKQAEISRIKIIQKPLAIYRLHDQSYTIKNYTELIKELKIWVDYNNNFKNYNNIKYFNNKLSYYQVIDELNKKNYFSFIKILTKIIFTRFFIKTLYILLKKLFQ